MRSVGVPHLLLVDDSESALALLKSVLAQHYVLSTAGDGVEALEVLARRRPDAVLLDLSMPQMDGEEVLARMQADATLATVPVIVVSSEQERGAACLDRGAVAFLHKPYRREQLMVTVDRVLAEHARKDRGDLAVLPVTVGPIALGVDLDRVRLVASMVATQPVAAGVPFVDQYFLLRGDRIAVVDLADRLGVRHAEPLLEWKLVVVDTGDVALALCVDRVADPEAIAEGDVVRFADAPAGAAFAALVTTSRGALPVVNLDAVLAPDHRRRLTAVLDEEPA
jgi:CheY-like chemotaxis protein